MGEFLVTQPGPTGRHRVDIETENKTEVAVGRRGTINRMQAIFKRGTKERERAFIEKEYHTKGFMKKALNGYKLAQEAGLKVLPTFRQIDERRIIMTDATAGDNFAVSPSNKTEEYRELMRVKTPKISNFDEFLEEFFDDVTKASSQNSLILCDDVFFFMMSKKSDAAGKLSYVCGDFEEIRDSCDYPFVGKEILAENINAAGIALFYFLEECVDKPLYLLRLREELQKRAREHDLPMAHLSVLTRNLHDKFKRPVRSED